VRAAEITALRDQRIFNGYHGETPAGAPARVAVFANGLPQPGED